MTKIISIVKDGRRIDLTQEQFLGVLNKEWDESKHPREKGKFAPAGGGADQGKTEPKAEGQKFTAQEHERIKDIEGTYTADAMDAAEDDRDLDVKDFLDSDKYSKVPQNIKDEVIRRIEGEVTPKATSSPKFNPSTNRVRGESQYVFAHGKKPGGTGSWAFKDKKGKTYWIHNKKYSEAKAQAERTIDSPVVQT